MLGSLPGSHRAAGGEAFVKILVELNNHDLLDVIPAFASLLGNFDQALVLTLPVVHEPTRDLLHRKLGLQSELLLFSLLNIRVLDVVKKPLLQDRCLLFRKHLLL